MKTQTHTRYEYAFNRIFPVLIVILYEQLTSLALGSKPNLIELLIFYLIDVNFYFISSLALSKWALAMNYAHLRAFFLCVFFILLYPFFSWLSQSISTFLIHGKFYYKMRGYAPYSLRGVWITGFAIITSFYKDGIAKARASRQAEFEKLQLEAERKALKNAHLKAQIKPHLLFNTLNFVYAQVFEVSQVAADAVFLLNELMKYAVTEPQPNGKVLLSDELDQIENYLSLIRLQDNSRQFLSVSIDRSDFWSSLEISPYILLTLIENVFKHGLTNNPEHPGKIHLRGQGNTLFLHTCNLKAVPIQSSFHVGKRYVLALLEREYRGRFIYDVKDSNQYYQLNLQIEL